MVFFFYNYNFYTFCTCAICWIGFPILYRCLYCKAAGLMRLALAWYAAEPLCCAQPAHTHTPPWHSTVGQPRCYIALEPDATYAPVC